jgi:hypothetical protein
VQPVRCKQGVFLFDGFTGKAIQGAGRRLYEYLLEAAKEFQNDHLPFEE